MELFSLKGKNAIIIGGSRGIGKGIAKGLAEAGACVVLVSRKQADVSDAAHEIAEATGARALGIAKDISSVEAIYSLVDQVADELEHIDILVNAAGVNVRKGCLDYEEQDWDLVQNVQLKSVFFMCQAVARHMVQKGIKGKLINVGSITATIALKNMVSYCAAKGGSAQVTKVFALELAPYGICANMLVPGYTSTEMTKPLFSDPEKVAEMMARIPQKRFGLPEDYAGLAVYLASAASDYMTGQIVSVDGGWLAS